MIIFLDESGDPGFKVAKGSSKTFVIALIVFDEELDAEETAVTIKRFRQDLGRDENYEFKFNKCRKDYRTKFLKAVAKSPFRIRAIVVPKTRIYSSTLRHSKESFYNYAIKLVLKNHHGTIKNAKLRCDKRGEKSLSRELKNYLRRELNKPGEKIIANVRFRDSKKDVLIQLADMVAGSLRKYHEKDTGDAEIYWNIIKKREDNIWIFGL